MRLFSNKLRINKVANPNPIATAPVSASAISKPIYNEHNNPKDNIFHDLETPATHSFGITPPHSMRITGDGVRSSMFHLNEQKQRTGVVKPDANSWLKEPLVHQIGEHIQPGLYPKTVIRNYSQFNETTGEKLPPTPHSLQEYNPGKTVYGLDSNQKMDLQLHPHHAALRAMDWAGENSDRHYGNIMYDEHATDPMKQVGGIDNGGYFDYNAPKREQYAWQNLNQSGGNFSPEFRQGVINHDPEYIGSLFDRVANHPAHVSPFEGGYDAKEQGVNNGFLSGNVYSGTPQNAKENFLKRMAVMKNAMLTKDEKGQHAVRSPLGLKKYIQRHHPECS